jgi:hypothetical protein
MTFGVQYDDSSDLALMLSAVEDRAVAGRASRSIEANPSLSIGRSSFDPSDGANYAGGSSYTEDLPLSPSMSGLAGLGGANAATHPDILKHIRATKRYQKQQAGKPYPGVTNERSAGRGYLAPTTKSVKNDMSKGWNAASQPAAAPGVLEGMPGSFRDVQIGGMTYAEAFNYSPAPLTEQYGALRGLGAVTAPVGVPNPQSSNFAMAMTVLLGGAFAWWVTR